MFIFTPNTLIKSAEVNANFDELKAKTDYLSAPDTSWKYIGATGQPAFSNSWVNYETSESSFYAAAFYKDALGFVHLRGIVKNGTVNTAMFTLPTGYRPLRQIGFAVNSNNSFGNYRIASNGQAYLESGSNVFVFLDNIHFKAEQ